MTHIPQGPASCSLADPDISPFLVKYLVGPLRREGTSESPEPAAFHARYKRAAREIIVVAACAVVGGLAIFFCGAERIGVVFFHSLRLFPSDCCHCLHVSCRGKQTTLFILPIHVFQIGSPSLVVESLICRGASPSAPVDSSSSQPQRAPYPVPDFPVGVPEPNQPDIGTAQHVVSVSMRAVLAAWTLDSKASSRVCPPHRNCIPP